MSLNGNKEVKGLIDISAANDLTVMGDLDVIGDLTVNGGPVAGGGGPVTGSTNFFTTNRLDSQGVLLNSSGSLVLSSSITSTIYISGNFTTQGQAVSRLLTTLTPTTANLTINWNNGNNQIVDLGSTSVDVGLTCSNPIAGGHYTLTFVQHPSVPRNVGFPSNTKWPDGTGITITTSSGSRDIVGIFYDGITYYANAGQNYL